MWRRIREVRERQGDSVSVALQVQEKMVEEVCADLRKLMGKEACGRCDKAHLRNRACPHFIAGP